MVKRKTLETWIHEALNDEDKDGACTALTLLHMIGQVSSQEIHTKRLSAGGDPAALAAMFRGKAETFAQDQTTTQNFRVGAFYGDKQEPQAFFTFQVTPESAASAGTVVDAPDGRGALAQAMRFNEIAMQIFMRNNQTIFEQQNRTIEMLGAREERLMRENHDAFDIVRDVIMARAHDDHESRMKELDREKSNKDREALMKFAPALTNQIFGREIFPQATADTSLINAIADHVQPQHLQLLAQVLPNEVAAPLANRIASYLQEKQDAERKRLLARQALAHSTVDAELGPGPEKGGA